jgi:hypothetical protein
LDLLLPVTDSSILKKFLIITIYWRRLVISRELGI